MLLRVFAIDIKLIVVQFPMLLPRLDTLVLHTLQSAFLLFCSFSVNLINMDMMATHVLLLAGMVIWVITYYAMSHSMIFQGRSVTKLNRIHSFFPYLPFSVDYQADTVTGYRIGAFCNKSHHLYSRLQHLLSLENH